MPTEPLDYRQLFLRHWQRLETLAQRRFADANLADEAMLHVQEAMAKEQWAALRAHDGRSGASFSTYFNLVAKRMLENFARARFGRVQTPRWVREQGALWEEVFRLLCLERMPPVQVSHYLDTAAPEGRDPVMVWAAITTIARRVGGCGQSPGEEIPTDPEVLDEMDPEEAVLHRLSPDELQHLRQRESVMSSFHRFLTGLGTGNTLPSSGGDTTGRRLLQRVRAHLDLSGEERLLLKLLYQDGLSPDAVARLLGLTVNQVYGRQRRLLGQIRDAIARAGLSRELLALLPS